MIPDYKISESIEHKVKNRENICKRRYIEEYSVKIYDIDPYFSEHYKKKYKLIKMVDNTYCLELIFIYVNIV